MTETTLRALRRSELSDATALCLRSKAYWGYSDDFIEACRTELTITPGDLRAHAFIAAEMDGKLVGIAQIVIEGDEAELEKLFVEPRVIGSGVGRRLFQWVREHAIHARSARIRVTADPDAVPFYQRMGFELSGGDASASIPGRMLPTLTLSL